MCQCLSERIVYAPASGPRADINGRISEADGFFINEEMAIYKLFPSTIYISEWRRVQDEKVIREVSRIALFFFSSHLRRELEKIHFFFF